MMDAMVRLGDSAAGYAALVVLLVTVTVAALVRLIAVLEMLNRYHARGEHAGFKYEEMHE